MAPEEILKAVTSGRIMNSMQLLDRAGYKRPTPETGERAPPRADAIGTAPDSYGTGFFIGAGGHIISNSHVVEGCTTIETADHVSLKLIEVNRTIDIALLQAPGFKPPSTASFRKTDAVLGEGVIVFGFPLPGLLSKSGNLTTGVVSATSGLRNNARNLQISAPVQAGNSGGPIVDQSGNVIGVVVSKLNAARIASATGDLAQNVNFAIKSGEIISFLGLSDAPPKLSTLTAKLTTEAVAIAAALFTVQIMCRH